jgi:hypothetical protein
MKIIRIFLFLVPFYLSHTALQAQSESAPGSKIYRVGVFAPLYLDSVFANGQYKFKDQMPKMLIPALEFSEGVQIALDTLKSTQPIHTILYDYKSDQQNIIKLYENKAFDSLDLIIASASGVEYKQLADIALRKNIPFISATYPNDGGVTKNPFVIILNATLNTHCNGIYEYLLKTFPTSRISLFRKPGALEDQIASRLSTLNMGHTGNPVLKINTVNKDSIELATLEAQLDSTRVNTIITGTLDENFGKKLASCCAALAKKYTINLIGMPNWDGIKDFNKPEFKNLAIYYSASFYNPETDEWSTAIKNAFKEQTNGTAMDMVYKGFESTYYFLGLLLKNGNNFMSHLNDPSLKIFTDYDIKPVMLSPQSTTPDYFENKKVYILKKQNGIITKMN